MYRSSKKHYAHVGLNVGLAELPTTLRWLCRQWILKCASLGFKGSIGGTIHAEVGIMQHDQSTHTALGFSTRNTYAGVQFHELLLSHHVDHHQELVMQKLWQPMQSPVSSLCLYKHSICYFMLKLFGSLARSVFSKKDSKQKLRFMFSFDKILEASNHYLLQPVFCHKARGSNRTESVEECIPCSVDLLPRTSRCKWWYDWNEHEIDKWTQMVIHGHMINENKITTKLQARVWFTVSLLLMVSTRACFTLARWSNLKPAMWLVTAKALQIRWNLLTWPPSKSWTKKPMTLMIFVPTDAGEDKKTTTKLHSKIAIFEKIMKFGT